MPENSWMPSEDNVLRRSYPDYRKILNMLPHRTLRAIQWRTQSLGIAKKRPLRSWKQTERAQVAREYETRTLRELSELHPDRSMRSIGAALERAAGKKRKPSTACHDIPVLSDIRARCLALGIPFNRLYAEVGTNKFLNASSAKGQRYSHATIAKAVALLGGELYVEWED